jgi:response regulator RpfG family c-di-GMP phosphodiesterase
MNPKILLVESNPEFRRILALNLNVYLNAEVKVLSNADEVISNLKKEVPDLIICEDQVNEENTILKVVYYISSQNAEIPVILLGQNNKIADMVTSIDKADWKGVVKHAAEILKITAERMMEQESKVENFFPLDIYNLSNVTLEDSACDVFIREFDGYKQIIEAGKEFPHIFIQDLILDGVTQVFIKKDERLKFINQFTSQVLLKLQDKNLTDSERNKLTETGFNTVRDMISLTGINDHALDLAEASVGNMTKTVEGAKGLDQLLTILQRDCNSYSYKHCLLISGIAHFVISKMDWGSSQQQDKICFISFFHDITLTEELLVKIHNKEDLDSAELTTEERNKIMNHALDAANLVKANKKSPYGADSIIIQHHGNLNGIGFSDGLNASLSPLAIVFMVCQDYADIILSVEPEFFNRQNALRPIKAKYNKGMFKKVVEVLEKI